MKNNDSEPDKAWNTHTIHLYVYHHITARYDSGGGVTDEMLLEHRPTPEITSILVRNTLAD